MPIACALIFANPAVVFARDTGSPIPAPPSTVGLASVAQPTSDQLQTLRRLGDIRAQRRHAWSLLNRLTVRTPDTSLPEFESWQGEDRLFEGIVPAVVGRAGVRSFARAEGSNLQTAAAALVTYTLYNGPAFSHFVLTGINRRRDLERLQRDGPADSMVTGARTLDAFPAQAMILKTVWWPVAPTGLTALPVWDPELNPTRKGGNDYMTWKRVVAVDPSPPDGSMHTAAVEFAGVSHPRARRVGLEDFYHVRLDADLARRLNNDESSKKAALITLGRELAEGDFLVLVAGNLATKEIDDWIWAAFWWHDYPTQGPYAADRPGSATPESRHFLMQVAFDPELPRGADGLPHVCFNPWLEGRFPDGGSGSGVVSNCMACHSRASYPAVGFLPVTRGAPDLVGDEAFNPKRLRASFLWAIPLHAVP